MKTNELKLFTGNANRPLAQRIAEELQLPLGKARFKRFSDGELWVKFEENIRGVDVFIVQPTHPPAENLLELLILVDAARRASAQRITAVIPYFGYARQDRKDQPRVPISAKLVANLLSTAGADRVLTIDLHAPQIQGFFDIPVDQLSATCLFDEYFQNRASGDLMLVAPDLGRFKGLAEGLDVPRALGSKRRAADGEVRIEGVLGEVDGKDLLVVDDIVSSGATLVESIRALKARGAGLIYVGVAHALLTRRTLRRLDEAPIAEMVITDTVSPPDVLGDSKVTTVSVAPLLAEAIARIHREESVSALYQRRASR